MNRVDGKTAIVTGGGSGIGRATCVLLAAAGAKVLATDINEAAAEETAVLANKTGGVCHSMKHDVTSEADWQAAMEFVVAEFGGLNILVNSAGISGAGLPSFEEATLASWQQVMSINLDAVFIGCQKAVMLMKQGSGSIINISSIMGIVGGAGPAYNASKGGVRLLTKSIAAHCGVSGYPVRVNSVHPGYIWTPMVKHIVEVLAGSDPAESNMTEEGLKAMLTEKHPIGRLGEAEDIARGILFLASDDSSFMTGSELVIDGGYTAV